MISTVPTWDRYLAPVLQLLADGQVHHVRDLPGPASDLLGVTDAERAEVVNSGRPRYQDRAQWAITALHVAGAIERVSRGDYRITDLGQRLCEQHPDGIAKEVLLQIPAYAEWRRRSRSSSTEDALATPKDNDVDQLSPQDLIDQGIAQLDAEVATELLRRLHDQQPGFFERAVVRLLLAMGYGGAEGGGAATQLSNDGGIDGIIDQDALGLSRIYVQAKRYASDNIVHRPAIQAFVGALAGNQANQGVFITTSRFSSGAIVYAEQVPSRVVLIDGERLARLMIRYKVGVQVKRPVEIVEIDEDFFE